MSRVLFDFGLRYVSGTKILDGKYGNEVSKAVDSIAGIVEFGACRDTTTDMLLTAFTILHVAISLVAIAAGFVVVYGLLNAKRLDGWTKLFLVTTILTSVTGFGFPVDHFMPSHALAIISLLALGVAVYARYPRQMAGGWRATYVISAMISLYLNVFVLVVQSFLKVPPLHALAPQGTEPPFAIAQGIVLVAFIVLGVLTVKRFRG